MACDIESSRLLEAFLGEEHARGKIAKLLAGLNPQGQLIHHGVDTLDGVGSFSQSVDRGEDIVVGARCRCLIQKP
jgi:hypothetical protein